MRNTFLNPEYFDVPTHNLLEAMLENQRLLQLKFIPIEGSPDFPCDLSTKGNQALIKDFIYRILEELAEAFENVPKINVILGQGIGTEDTVPLLENFNEEMADALHFWFNLLLYTNVTIGQVKERMGIPVDITSQEDSLDILLRYAGAKNQKENTFCDNRLAMMVPYLDDDLTDRLKGGRYISNQYLYQHTNFLWFIANNLLMSANELKARKWRLFSPPVKEDEFRGGIADSFILFLRYLSFCSFTKESLFIIYMSKNEINHKRIEEKR